jgi:hypothetical protein
MDRREFLLNTAKASGVVLPWCGLLPLSNLANAQSSTGKLLVYYHCDGGWDHDSWSDPAIGAGINNYTTQGLTVPRVGRMAIAPMGNAGSNAAFLQRFNSQLIFVNGVNTQTNSHEDGSFCASTGRLEMGYAPICELHAAKYGPGYPAAWIARDDARATASTGLVTATPVPDGNQLRAMVTPNSASATQDRMKQADYMKTVAARDARLQALKATGVSLPKESLITEQFLAGKEARARLEAVAALIPATFTQQFADIEVAAIAMQAGITAAAQITSGGFDVHGDVEDMNGPNGALVRMSSRLTFLMDEAQRRGIADRLLVVVSAEFGRTLLNNSGGKDHNNVGGSYTIILPPGTGLGDRTVGYTGPRHEQRTINPTTGAPDPNGIVLNPKHVHTAIHEYLGFTSSAPGGLGVPAAEKLKLFSATCQTGHPSLPA